MMKKYPLGFMAHMEQEMENTVPAVAEERTIAPRKSVVTVYFPSRNMTLSYYNDSFDLQVGDRVYVEGKLEGHCGQVTKVNYSFKIKLSDYKRVISVVDTAVHGKLYLSGSHLMCFDSRTIPFDKVLTWFVSPTNEEEYVAGDDDETGFLLSDLSGMHVSPYTAERGHEYYTENRVAYLSVDGTEGCAIVEGSENYVLSFRYTKGEISNLKCSCFCGDTCKHEFAAMLQLKECLEMISERYEKEFRGYFAAVSKKALFNILLNQKISGAIQLEV